jgi:hypothetical protein
LEIIDILYDLLESETGPAFADAYLH